MIESTLIFKNDEERKRFIEIVKSRIETIGMTQSQVAIILGLKPRTLWNFLGGGVKTHISLSTKLATFLKIERSEWQSRAVDIERA